MFVGVPDPTTSASSYAGGGLYVRLVQSGSGGTGCVDNNVTVILDKQTDPNVTQSCFVRTEKLNIRDFGAKGDTRSGFVDGSFYNGSTTVFCSSTAVFTQADVNKRIYIQGAGAGFSPPQNPTTNKNPNVGPHYATLDTTIASLSTMANCVNLAQGATTSPIWGSEPGPKVTASGTGYSPGDKLQLGLGTTFDTSACAGNPYGGQTPCETTVAVNLVTLVSATIKFVGSNSTATAGQCVLTGTSGTALGGQYFQITATVTAGHTLDTSQPVSVVMKQGGFYSKTPSLTAETVSGCGFPAGSMPTVVPVFGVGQVSMLWNGMYTTLPSGTTQAVANAICSISTCSGATFDASTSAQMNVFSVGTDDTPPLTAALAAQREIASIAGGTNMNTHICLYAPAGVYSVLPLNTSGSTTGTFAGNGCIEGDGHLQTIFHLRPNVAGDLFAWDNAQGNNSRPYNGNILLLKVDQAGPIAHGFAVEGDRNSNADQNALNFYGMNDYILATDIEVDYLLGSGMRCGDALTSKDTATFCRESHFRDLHFTRVGDGVAYPVVSFDAAGNTDGDNNLDLSDIDIYNPRGTGMLFTDHASTGGNADHNIAMARIRWEGSELSVAGITTDLLEIDGGNQGTSHLTCSVCRWENPYLGAAAIHLVPTFLSSMKYAVPADIELDGRIINSTGFGRGIQIDGGKLLVFNLNSLSTLDYNVAVGPSAYVLGNSVFLNGYGAEATWTYVVDSTSTGFILGPVARVQRPTPSGSPSVSGSSLQVVVPTVIQGCSAVRGQGAVDLQTDCQSATQGATGTDAALSSGQNNTVAGNQAFVGAGLGNSASGTGAAVAAGSANAASGTYAAIVSGQNNTASGANSLVGGSGANDIGRMGTSCWSSNPVAAASLTQSCTATFFKTTSGAASVRLTSDGAGPGPANIFNIPLNTAFSIRVTLTAIDTAATGNNVTAVWSTAYILTKNGAGATTLNGVATTFPPDGVGTTVPPSGTGLVVNGNALTAAPTIKADNTNGGLYIAFTPPTGNSDPWHIGARVDSMEIQ